MAKTTKRKPKSPKLKIVGKTKNAVVVMDSVEKFMLEFLKNGGNVTQAAMKVGNFSNLQSANVSGSRWLAKAKQRGLVRSALEKKGYDYGKLMDVALEKMENSKKPDWWDRIMKMANYEDFTSGNNSGGTNVNVNIPLFAAHRKLSEEYIDGEIEGGETIKEPAQNEDKL